MLLAKSRPIVVIFIADGSHFARERLTAFTPWHPDAVSGSHPPHPLMEWSGRAPALCCVDRLSRHPESGHYSIQSVCLKRANNGSRHAHLIILTARATRPDFNLSPRNSMQKKVDKPAAVRSRKRACQRFR